MRISVINWRTSDADVEATIAAVARVLSRMDAHLPSKQRTAQRAIASSNSQ
jgi:hypothetical protein